MGKAVEPQQLQSALEQLRHEPLSSGYKSIDEVTGGLPRGGVVLLGARPGMGLTSLALNMVSRIAQKEPGNILYLSNDRTERDIAASLLQIGTDMELNRMLDGTVPKQMAGDYCASFLKSMKANIHVEHLSFMTMEDIRYHTEMLQNLRLVVVDSPEWIFEDGEELWADGTPMPTEEVLRQLKWLAKGWNVPVICMTHLKRKLELRYDKRPRLTDLTSPRLAEPADQVWLLYREAYYNAGIDDMAECIVVKNNNGKTGTTRLLWTRPCGRFDEV